MTDQKQVMAELQKATESFNRALASFERIDVKGLTLSEMATFYFNFKNDYEAADTARKSVFKVLDGMAKGTLPERFEHEGLDQIKVAEIARSFYPLRKHGAKIVDSDKAKVWLTEHGGEHLYKETVHAQSLSSFLQECLKSEGIEPPQEAIETSSYSTTGISKYNADKS